MISGSKKEVPASSFGKKTGVFEANVVAINPTLEELNEMLGTEFDKEYEYTGTNNEGKQKATVSVWLREVATGQLFNLRFFLTNQVRESRANPGKLQWINEVGQTSWANTQGELGAWFTKRDSRACVMGEEELHNFLRAWLNLDYMDASTTCLLDTSKLFKGDCKEMRDCMKNFSDSTVMCLATVRVVAGDTETVEYQGVYNKKFLPGGYIKYFKDTSGKEYPKSLTKWIDEVKDPQHGCQDYFKMTTLVEYNKEDNIVAGDKAIDDKKDNSNLY